MPTPRPAVRLIERQPELDSCCAALARQSVVGLDTEFARTDTYRPRLCLVQLAADHAVSCVDVLSGLDATALWNVLCATTPLKLVHAAKQDLEVLRLSFGGLPGAIFDTQVGAALVGHPAQIGYAALVEAELGVRLDKSHTRTDWSRRPLSQEQLVYAGNDVAFLPELHQRLRSRLVQQGRADWAEEDSAALLDPVLYEPCPENAWQRLSGVRFLALPIQARVRRLAAWRENRAAGADRPRQWILSDQALLDIAHADPRDLSELGALRSVPAGTVRKSGETLLAQLRAAGQDLASGTLDLRQEMRPAAVQNGAVRKLSQIVQRVAGELGIAPEVLATRSDLMALYRGSRAVRPLQGWRRAVIGEALLVAL
jgi:ribonuclease D